MQTIVDEDSFVSTSSYHMFTYSIRNEVTRKYYERRLKRFFDFIGFDLQTDLEERCNSFVRRGLAEGEWAISQIISFLQFEKERVRKREIAAATLRNFVKAIKLFCEVSEIHVPWRKITRGLPHARQAANDRAPTIEEIQKLIQYPDRRIKAIIYTMASSGIRLGAWDYLLWKLISPINNQPLGNSCEQLVDWIKNLMQNQGRATGIRKNPKLNNDKRKAFTLTKVSLRVSLHKKFLHELESVIEH